jgi:hypothetical protein
MLKLNRDQYALNNETNGTNNGSNPVAPIRQKRRPAKNSIAPTNDYKVKEVKSVNSALDKNGSKNQFNSSNEGKHDNNHI